jgi:serine protease Do
MVSFEEVYCVRRFVMLGVVAMLAAAGCASFHSSNGAAKYQPAIDAVYPALVRIKVVTPGFRGGREVRMQAGGSGAIISADGYVVTNHHVAGKATSIVCVLSNKEEIPAIRVGTDALTDICVLKLPEGRTYPFARFGDSSEVRVGDTVLAMGSPGSISQSVTAGVASNVDLILPYGSLQMDGENVGSVVKWIAHDAAIFPGNSGGPLVNLRGDIIGINEIGMGLGGAIPGNLAKQVVAEIIADGEPRRSTLGIVVQPLLRSSDRTTGALVSGVLKDTPAEAAGFEPGDILLTYDGQPVTVRFGEDMPVFNRMVLDTPIGKAVPVVVERNGEPKTLTVTSQLRERALGDNREITEWGMTGRDITETGARYMKRDSADGVMVTTTRPGGPCAEAKPEIRPGDILVEINNQPVKSLEDLTAKTEKLLEGQSDPVRTLVAFERRGQKWLTLVRVGISDLPDRSPEARRAWLPADFQVLTTDLAEALGHKGATGIRLTDVFKERSAEQAGLKVGDIITAIDGDPVRTSREEEVDVFPAMVRQRRVGQEVKLSVLRAGQSVTVPVTLERSPPATREMRRYRHLGLGFTARDLSDEDRRTQKVEPMVHGPVVAEVEPGSLAAVANLRGSDIVLSADGQPTPDVKTLRKVMVEIEKAGREHLVLLVSRGIHTAFIEIETPWVNK